MATIPRQTPLDFHCGVCACELTDATCLFTSCGHFFCDTGQCTDLTKHSINEKCEQCGKTCDAGTLEDKAAKLDEHTRRFVFGNLEKDLKEAINVLQFRSRHDKILRKRTVIMVKEVKELKQEIYHCLSEKEKLEKELEVIRTENGQLRKQLRRVVSRRSVENKSSAGDPNESLSRAPGAEFPSASPSIQDAPIPRVGGAPSMRTEIAINQRNTYQDDNARKPYDRRRPVDPRVRRMSPPRRREPVPERRTSNFRRSNDLTYNSSRLPANAYSIAMNRNSVRPVPIDQPITRSGTLLKKRSIYGASTITDTRCEGTKRTYAAGSSSQFPSKTDRLLRRSDPKPSRRTVLEYGKTLQTNFRTQRNTRSINTEAVSNFASLRSKPGGISKPWGTSTTTRTTRTTRKTWKPLPTYSTRLPKMTAVDDWRKKRKKKSDEQ